MLLRTGNAGSNTAVDHIAVARPALRAAARPPAPDAGPGRQVLIRTDAAGATHEFLNWLTAAAAGLLGRVRPARPTWSRLLKTIPRRRGPRPTTPTTQIRDGAWVAELTGLLDLSGWPPGMRVIVRAERPHPGAQLRFTDVDGLRVTAFVTNTTRGQLADLELRHRRRARAEDPQRAQQVAPPPQSKGRPDADD